MIQIFDNVQEYALDEQMYNRISQINPDLVMEAEKREIQIHYKEDKDILNLDDLNNMFK